MMRSRSRCVLVLVLVAYILWLTKTTSRPGSGHDNTTGPSHNSQDLTLAIRDTPFIEEYSLTVILPVISNTIPRLDKLLAPFLVPTKIVYEVAIVCPDSLASETRRKLRLILSNASQHHPKMSLYPWSGLIHHNQAALEIAPRIKTDWVLLLDEHAFEQISDCDTAYLTHPRAFHFPAGPRGYAAHNVSVSPSDYSRPAAYLIPPFVVRTNLLFGTPLTTAPASFWPSLGNYIFQSNHGMIGGVVIGSDVYDARWCPLQTESEGRISDGNPDYSAEPNSVDFTSVPTPGFFTLVFPRKEDLGNFLPAACKLCDQGYTVSAYLYDPMGEDEPPSVLEERNCTIPYFNRSKEIPSLSDWLNSLGRAPDVVVGLDHQDSVSATFSLILERHPFLNSTLIRLPRQELPYTEWIGTLCLQELRHWNVPEITLSVITNNRPHSLRRLLESIQHTMFYGDKVALRVNMDQTSDSETLRLVQDLEWDHGDVFLHHRVIHGGLLPAVVESWYPHSNDSYALLLEDDIELSPLSYAWIKMTLLRYRYGDESPSSSKLFGISLYQQKIIELRPKGRQPFNATKIFQSSSLPSPSTPYLSQIPCSWGALYFPSQWREFHDYLSLRLSQYALPMSSTVVPGVRSNKWTKSWKKYFIELVYLRGYVMLYPNYEDFVSFSTNHLEVGSHVKDDPVEVYEKKKRMFSLPLMRLDGAEAGHSEGEGEGEGDRGGPRLLDLPGGTLPDWQSLPVLDLWGELTLMDDIQRRGEERRAEFSECSGDALLPSSVRDLLCNTPL